MPPILRAFLVFPAATASPRETMAKPDKSDNHPIPALLAATVYLRATQLISSFRVACVIGLLLAAPQQVPTRTLSTPIAEFAEPFTEVRGVRELSDGRVIVNDFRDRYVKLVDFRARTAQQLGRHGSGPGEYQLPLMIMTLAGDTTAVHDMASGDLVLILPNGSMGGSISTTSSEPGAAQITTRSRSDARGRIFSELRPVINDSLRIQRYDRATGRRDVVAYVSPYAISPFLRRPAASAPTGGSAPPGGRARPGGAPPFMTTDQWAVANDGRVAMVSVEPYRVTFTETDGRRWSAEPIAAERIRVTEAHKVIWREAKARPVASISFGPGGVDRTAGFTTRPVEEPSEWPEFLPPFLSDALSFAPNGMLWVQRTTAADAAPTFELIDPRGRLAARVVLPQRSRLVGFGATSVYVVRRDNDDLEYLRKYNLPGVSAG